MGVEPSPAGVTLEMCDKNGNVQSTYQGAAAKLYSKPRPAKADLSPVDHEAEYGSDDWLTDVLVAKSQDDLSSFSPSATMEAATSGSSKNVLVHHAAGGSYEPLKDRTTIAYGSPIAGGRLSVDKIKVLPPETEMKPGHPLWHDWVKQTKF